MRKGSNKEALIEQLESAAAAVAVALSLAKKDTSVSTSKKAVLVKKRRSAEDLDFSRSARAFIKKYGPGMSGPKKFTLLLAYLAKGDTKAKVPLADIEKHWSKMTAKNLMAMEFNPVYASRARENDWVSTEKSGSYHLRSSWEAIFDE